MTEKPNFPRAERPSTSGLRSDLRRPASLRGASMNEEGVRTSSSSEQVEVEASCLRIFQEFHDAGEVPILRRVKTIKFLRRGLENLSCSYECLDASRPWICYWILHSLALLGETVPDDQAGHIVDFLSRCQSPDGGFGGGPGQVAHLAPTYGAVNALCTLNRREAYRVIDREKLSSWMDSLRLEDGSFLMHRDGEVDIRGVYCALAVARLTNIYTPELFRNTARWVLRCQTYEGGFGGAPHMEAHGGYSFCGLAALVLMDRAERCDIEGLLRWATNRQMGLEGGFQGRTNKLVDGCYSFWQGGLFPLLHVLLNRKPEQLLFDTKALQEYLLICCQDSRGGLVDKPGKGRDFYHTCYALSGLSVSQYHLGGPSGDGGGDGGSNVNLVGPSQNMLKPTHPLYNISISGAISAAEFFDNLPIPRLNRDTR